ncbi:secreted protein, partial [gut metagenome]
MMKNFFATVSVLAAIVSCGPSYFSLPVEKRQPSQSGFGLEGKSVSVAYLTNESSGYSGVRADSGYDSVFVASLADGLASALENDYFSGEKAIELYNIRRDVSVDYSSRDVALDVLMGSGSDVIFIVDVPAIGAPEKVSAPGNGNRSSERNPFSVTYRIPYSLSVYVYDSMAPRDTVRKFGATSSIIYKC